MNFLRLIDKVFKPSVAYAHCDIPCGIYETNTLLLAAKTVKRMVEVIETLPKENPAVRDRNTFVRCVKVKENHAQLCKDQLFILWADFFKEEHLEKFPDLHEKFWKAVKLASDNKQDVSIEKADALIAAVSDVASMFEEVKVKPKESLAGTVSDNPDSPKKKLLS